MTEKQYTVTQSFYNDKVGAHSRGDVVNFDAEMASELTAQGYLQEGVQNLSDDANEPMKSSANPEYKDEPITAYGSRFDANPTATVDPTATVANNTADTEFASEMTAPKTATRKATDK